jgi:hypothetical protein
MPSQLFNVLFVLALFVPAAMYITGVAILMTSLVVKHFRGRVTAAHPIEATAH